MTFNVYYFLNNYYLNKYSVFQVRVLTNSKPEWLTPKDKVRQTFHCNPKAYYQDLSLHLRTINTVHKVKTNLFKILLFV